MPTKEIISQIAKKNNTSAQDVEKELFYALTFCDKNIIKPNKSKKTQNFCDDVLEYCIQKVFEKLF